MSLQTLDEYLQELAATRREIEEVLGIRLYDFGATSEEEAESVLQHVLENRGYRRLGETYVLPVHDRTNMFRQFETPTGKAVWTAVDVVFRLDAQQVEAWAQQMKSAGWQQRLAENGVAGPYLVYSYSIRSGRGVVQAAEEEGIGLLTIRGEQVAPEGLIRSPVA
ncbi:MAG: hypothetical protein MAG451_01645 [Anaerolineales bacterium]|nr:hypothetical protein [Anaerolineales bacterium]